MFDLIIDIFLVGIGVIILCEFLINICLQKGGLVNYIQKLQKENEILRDGIESLCKYLAGEKFYSPNNSVNVLDIFLRVEEMKDKLFRMEE